MSTEDKKGIWALTTLGLAVSLMFFVAGATKDIQPDEYQAAAVAVSMSLFCLLSFLLAWAVIE